MDKTYDCPICHEPCYPLKKWAHIKAKPVVQFRCVLGHNFYIDQKNVEYPDGEPETDSDEWFS